jgi:LmbE family N-acetylglucosaminyl deacetylase
MTVLVVAAHPDDEILGCGGSLARHARLGERVHVLILAEGATARDPSRDVGTRQDDLLELQQAARRAATALGVEMPQFGGFPDNRMDSVAILDVTKRVERAVEAFAPSVVYTHHGGDLNRDHRIVHEAVITACRPMPGRPVRRLLAFETLSSTEWASEAIGPDFRPRRFVDISADLDVKLRALECYAQEMRPFPHPRSAEAVQALARLRGSQVGLMAAEAFEVVFDIDS